MKMLYLVSFVLSVSGWLVFVCLVFVAAKEECVFVHFFFSFWLLLKHPFCFLRYKPLRSNERLLVNLTAISWVADTAQNCCVLYLFFLRRVFFDYFWLIWSNSVGKEKGSEQVKGPTSEELHAVISELLKEVDFNTVLISNISLLF